MPLGVTSPMPIGTRLTKLLRCATDLTVHFEDGREKSVVRPTRTLNGWRAPYFPHMAWREGRTGVAGECLSSPPHFIRNPILSCTF